MIDKNGEKNTPGRAIDESYAFLIRILPGNVEEKEYPVKSRDITTIGRSGCDINFPGDTLLSEKHASISHRPDGYFLRDHGSVNGVFLRAPEARPLEVLPGNLVRIGKQILLFTASNGIHNFIHYDQSGKEVNRYQISDKTIVLGRNAPHVTLDSQDLTLSRRHLAIFLKEDRVYIKDLKSANGTYLKVEGEVKIEHGDQFRVGHQVFTFTLRKHAALDSGLGRSTGVITPVPQLAPSRKVREETEEAKTGNIVVTFKDLGKSFAMKQGQTVCDVAEKNGIELNTECHAGICGSDPVRIVSGKENLNELGDEEKETIEYLCGLDSAECRMACMVTPKGPVEVEIVES
ncbi:MAG: FHA domain-containing protein [bacterium]